MFINGGKSKQYRRRKGCLWLLAHPRHVHDCLIDLYRTTILPNSLSEVGEGPVSGGRSTKHERNISLVYVPATHRAHQLGAPTTQWPSLDTHHGTKAQALQSQPVKADVSGCHLQGRHAARQDRQIRVTRTGGDPPSCLYPHAPPLQIWAEGKQLFLGSFSTQERAALAFDLASVKMRGGRRKPPPQTNFPFELYREEFKAKSWVRVVCFYILVAHTRPPTDSTRGTHAKPSHAVKKPATSQPTPTR